MLQSHSQQSWPRKLLSYVRHTFPTKAAAHGLLKADTPFTLSEARFYGKGLKALSDHFNGIHPLAATTYFNLKPYRSAYLLYFFPANWAKIGLILAETGRAFIPSQSFRILDVGSGPGPLAFGAIDFLQRFFPKPTSFEADLIDHSKTALQEAVQLRHTLFDPSDAMTLRIHPTTIAAHRYKPIAKGLYDLILLGDVLNEMDEKTHLDFLISLFQDHLKPGGQMVAIEPALQKTAHHLQRLRDLLRKTLPSAFILAPCLRQGVCPLNHTNRRDWCHFYGDWQPPDWFPLLEKTAGLRKEWLKYAYIVLQKDHTPVNSLDLWRVISNPMKSNEKQELVLCGPQGRIHLTGLFKVKSQANGDFFRLRRGDKVKLNPAQWPELRSGKESWDHHLQLNEKHTLIKASDDTANRGDAKAF